MPQDNQRFNIEAERARLGMTRKELYIALEISAPTYRTWLRGGSIPSGKLLKMANLFSCSVDYLLEMKIST